MLYDTTYYDNVKPRRRVRCRRLLNAAGAVRTRWGHPQAASFPGAPSWSTATAGGSVRPARGGPVGSICPDTENAPPCGRAERLRMVIASRQNYPGQRIASCAHSVARRSFLLKRRQASQQALLQRAARPNFFSSRRNTLSQTLPAFGTRCQPRRCLRSSRWTSVVSSYRSNPTHRVSPSPVQPARCHPLRSRREVPHLDCSYCAP